MKKFMRTFGLLFAMLWLSGCLSPNKYYILSMVQAPKEIYHTQENIIGVEKITLPAYLYKREIAIATSSSQITLLSDGTWGEDLDMGLTHRMIGFLQKKFNEPNVYAYPWGVERQVELKVSIQISRFIVQEGTVYLDATWSIEERKTRERVSKLFSINLATSSETVNIVQTMDKAFMGLEEVIAKAIKKFNMNKKGQI
jgi:cholesterol transport system auxiliary component